MKSAIRFSCFFLVVAIVLAVAPVRARAGETLRIGVCLSLSGNSDVSEAGLRTMAGIRMRAEELNAREDGPHIELIIRDDEGNPEVAKKMVAELVENEKLTAILGPDSPPLLFAVRDYLREKRVVALSPNVTSREISRGDGWTFRLMFDDELQAQALARYLFLHQDVRRVGAILNTHYPYPESVYAPFADLFAEMGGTIVAVERFDWQYDENEVYDFGPALENLMSARPDVVLVPLNALEVAEVIRDSLDTDLDATFCGTDTWESEELLMASGNNLADSIYVSGLNIGSTTEEMDRFLAIYDNSNDIYAEPSSVYGYDALSVLVECMLDGTESRNIRNNLYSLRNFQLATGPITIDRALGTLRPVYIHKIVKINNEFKPVFVDTVWPYGMQQR